MKQTEGTRLKRLFAVVKRAAEAFSQDNVLTLGAALAYYTIFSIAPLLIITIAICGWIFGSRAGTNQIFDTVSQFVGPNGAEALQAMVKSATEQPGTGAFSSIVGVTVLLLGASGVFGQLQDSLNQIWHVQPVPGRSLLTILRQRLLSFSIVMVIAFLLLVSLLVSATLAALGKYFQSILPASSILWNILNFVASFAVITFLFAAIFKILPDVHMSWNYVWRGALLTAFLFTVGKALIGLYLGRSGITSSFGAAGSLIGVIAWAYYSSAIVLFGVEVTRAYVEQIGHQVQPKPHCRFQPCPPQAAAEKPSTC